MKKLSKYLSLSLPPVKIFLEDIEKLDAIYKNNCQSYTIRTEDYELNSLEELKQLDKSEFYKIKFQSKDPQVSLEMSGKDTSIFAYEDNAVSTGIVTKLKEIIEPRFIKIKSSTSTLWVFLRSLKSSLPIVLMYLLSYLLSKDNFINTNDAIQLIGVYATFILLITIFIFNIITEDKEYPVLYLITKPTNKSFFIEHKNQITLLVIGGLITLCVQILVQWIKQTLLDPNL